MQGLLCRFQKTAALNVRSRLHYSSEGAWIHHAMTGGCRPGAVGSGRMLGDCFRLMAAVQLSSWSLQTRHSSQSNDDHSGCNDFVQGGAASRSVKVLGKTLPSYGLIDNVRLFRLVSSTTY